jgi:predicted O-methyltransferase YrrM
LRPPRALLDHPVSRSEVTTESVEAWFRSADYALESAYFEGYPPDALLDTTAKCFIYHCIRAMQPKVVVEIGTYKAGTSELIARALWENGDGKLFTTDPLGGDEQLETIASWPIELRPHVQFLAMNSMEFFLALEDTGGKIDVAFIDGNHDFEFALFDIQMAARNIQRSGIILIDNVEQSGVTFAAFDFLQRNPDWNVIGRDFRTQLERSGSPFERKSDRSFADGAWTLAVLGAPGSYSATSTNPFTTRNQKVDASVVTGFVLHPAPRATHHCDRFHWEVLYSTFPPAGSPIQINRRGTCTYGNDPIRVVFDEAIRVDEPGALIEITFLPEAVPGVEARMSFDGIELLAENGAQRIR